MTDIKDLFSAYAEVFPSRGHQRGPSIALLRIRGGISHSPEEEEGDPSSSPHTRRYFHDQRERVKSECLFSAYAEVFPRQVQSVPSRPSLLRIRGGISNEADSCDAEHHSSPHTRRYSH